MATSVNKPAAVDTSNGGTLPALLAKAQLTKLVDSCIEAAKTVQGLIGDAGLQALLHLEKHGDIGMCNRLYVGLPKGVRKAALGSWMLAHGALKPNTDAGTKRNMPLVYDTTKVTNPAAAMADAWYEHLPEKEVSDIFDLQKAIAGLLMKAAGKNVTIGGKVLNPAEANDLLKSFAASVGDTFKGEVKGTPHPENKETAKAE